MVNDKNTKDSVSAQKENAEKEVKACKTKVKRKKK